MRKRIESLLDPALNLIAQNVIQCNACFMDGRLKHSFVNLPQPRFIGSRYGSQDQKVVFVMLNPGAGKIDSRNMDLRNQLYRYRKGEAGLRDVFATQREQLSFWGHGKMRAFIELHGLDIDCIALANIAWCATAENKYPFWMLQECASRHTLKWLAQLRPSFIILSGVETHQFEGDIAQRIPEARILTTYHYAHRPPDAEKATARAIEIARILDLV